MTLDDAVALRTTGFIAAGSLFWLQYWDLKDRRRPEPRARLVAAFLLGGVSAAVALGLFRVAAWLGAPVHASSGIAALWTSLALVGPIEEGAKFGVARATVVRWRVFDERIDGVVYGAAVSLGFAAAENALWLPALGGADGLVRALCSPLIHTLFGALWGYGTAWAVLEGKTRRARIAGQGAALAVAAFAHGVYDAVLASGAPAVVVAGVVLVLWSVVLLLARRAALRDAQVAAAVPAPVAARPR